MLYCVESKTSQKNQSLKSQVGATFVEFTMVLTVFVAVILAGMEVARYQWVKGVLDTAVLDSLHYLTQSPYSTMDPSDEKSEIIRRQVRDRVLELANQTDAWGQGGLTADDVEIIMPPGFDMTSGATDTVSHASYESISDTQAQKILANNPLGIRVTARYTPLFPFPFSFTGGSVEVTSQARGFAELPLKQSAPTLVDCHGNKFGDPGYGLTECPCLIDTHSGIVNHSSDGASATTQPANLACICPAGFVEVGGTCVCESGTGIDGGSGQFGCCDTAFVDHCADDNGVVSLSSDGCSCSCPGDLVFNDTTDRCECPGSLVRDPHSPDDSPVCGCEYFSCGDQASVSRSGDQCVCACVENATDTSSDTDSSLSCHCEGQFTPDTADGSEACVCDIACDGPLDTGNVELEECQCQCLWRARRDRTTGECSRCHGDGIEIDDPNRPGRSKCVCDYECPFNSSERSDCRGCNCESGRLLIHDPDNINSCLCKSGAVPNADNSACICADDRVRRGPYCRCPRGKCSDGKLAVPDSTGACTCRCPQRVGCANVVTDSIDNPNNSCGCVCAGNKLIRSHGSNVYKCGCDPDVTCPAGKEYVDLGNRCECVCKNRDSCTNGTVINPETCECECPGDLVPGRDGVCGCPSCEGDATPVRDGNSCDCECPYAEPCANGGDINPTTCECECPPGIECGVDGAIVDQATCECGCTGGAISDGSSCVCPDCGDLHSPDRVDGVCTCVCPDDSPCAVTGAIRDNATCECECPGDLVDINGTCTCPSVGTLCSTPGSIVVRDGNSCSCRCDGFVDGSICYPNRCRSINCELLPGEPECTCDE